MREMESQGAEMSPFHPHGHQLLDSLIIVCDQVKEMYGLI
jgi:hypothetical protein